jgi:hypothetical protein
MPPDVRKAFGLPGSKFGNPTATPQFRAEPESWAARRSAQRFRTSDGEPQRSSMNFEAKHRVESK